MPQWLAVLDHTLARLHLETRFFGRHKFHHFRVWYRDRLRAYVRDVLLDPQTRSRAYFRHGALEEMVTRHIRGDRNYTLEIHRALTCELVQRRLIDQP
jgi:asparagine synthase (glutamine-hydrolysing)